jgi:hypothetical protein
VPDVRAQVEQFKQNLRANAIPGSTWTVKVERV